MPYQIENRMVVDSEWDEIEYGVRINKTRFEKQREAYDEAEREETHGERKHAF